MPSRPVEPQTKPDTRSRARERRDSDTRKQTQRPTDNTQLHRTNATRTRERRPSQRETSSRDKRDAVERKPSSRGHKDDVVKPVTLTRNNTTIERKSSSRHHEPSGGRVARHNSERTRPKEKDEPRALGGLPPASYRPPPPPDRDQTEKRLPTKHRDDYVSRRNTERGHHPHHSERMDRDTNKMAHSKEKKRTADGDDVRAELLERTATTLHRSNTFFAHSGTSRNPPQRSNTLPTPRPPAPDYTLPVRSKSAPMPSLRDWFWVPGSARDKVITLADNPMVPKDRPGWWTRTFGSKPKKRFVAGSSGWGHV